MEAVALLSREETLHSLGVLVGQVGDERQDVRRLLDFDAERIGEAEATRFEVMATLLLHGFEFGEGVADEDFFGGHRGHSSD